MSANTCVWHILVTLLTFAESYNLDFDETLTDARDFVASNYEGPRRA